VTTLIHNGTNARYSDTATRNIESILKMEKDVVRPDTAECNRPNIFATALRSAISPIGVRALKGCPILGCQKSDVVLKPCLCDRFRGHISGNLVYRRH
jgi:hypothetical protein